MAGRVGDSAASLHKLLQQQAVQLLLQEAYPSGASTAGRRS